MNKIKRTKESFSTGKEKLIVFASGGVLQDSEIIPALIKAVDEISDVRLIIKAHPLADVKLLKKIVKSTKSKKVKVLIDVNLYELLKISDLLVSVASTVVIEAMLFDKPVMLINVVKCPIPYAEMGGAYAVFETKDIKDGLIRCLNDKELQKKLKIGRKRFLRDYLYKLDGKASERIVKIIKDYLKS